VRSNQHSTNSEGRVADLDGVRAIAIWMVLLLHALYGFPNAAGALDFIPAPILLVLSHGWLGVDLFFVLSGFLITGILLGSKHRQHYFRNFYIRRVLRIMPVYFAAVFVWVLLYRGYGRYFLLSSVFGANLSMLLHIPTPHGPGVLWSLAVEEHFYLLWPLVVFLVNRRTLAVIAGILFLGMPLLRGYFAYRGMNPELIYMLSWFRFDGLATGAMLAIWARSANAGRRSSVYIAGCLAICFVVLTIVGKPFGLMGTKSIVSIALRYTQAYLIFAAFFVLVVAYRGTKWTAPLRWRFVQLSGALSYCLYLVHLSVGDGYEHLLKRSGIPIVSYLGASGTVLLRTAAILAVSFAIAMLSRKYLEEPFLSLKERFTEAGPLKVQAKKLESVTSA
jgi:peptidoglycan/LPS O-acetylase OafA/YrhL